MQKITLNIDIFVAVNAETWAHCDLPRLIAILESTCNPQMCIPLVPVNTPRPLSAYPSLLTPTPGCYTLRVEVMEIGSLASSEC